MNKDLTVGSPGRSLIMFTIPLFISVMFQQMYNIADSVIAGKFAGEDALAAIGASYPITMIFMAVAVGCQIGCSVVISKHFGAGNMPMTKTCISTALISGTALSAALTVVGVLFSGVFMQWVQTPDNIFDDGCLYLMIYTGGFVFLFLYNVVTGIFNSLGDSKTPLYLLIGSSVGNVILDCILIIPLQMGVAGAAWATFAAQGAACVLALFLLLRRVKSMKIEGGRLFSGAALADISKVAVPSVLQQSFISVGNLFIQYMVNGFGSSIVAGYSAAIKLNTFAITCFTTIGNGMSSFTAQNIGANKPERIKKGFRSVLIFSLATAAVFFLLFFILSTPLLSLFMNEDSSQLAMDTGVQFLQTVAPFYFVICLKLLCDGVLRGSESMGCFMAATFTDLILRVILAFILRYAMDSVTGIWISWPIAWIIATIMSVAFYKSGIWTKKLQAVPPAEKKEELAEEELVDEILEEHVDMTPDK